MPFISFIIPVYNVEPYLEQCVNSILNQNYQDIEVILVDDGSTDNSGRICDKYAESHSNIKVIHQKNQGQSVARNTGIDNANGEYIVFLDSDDFWRPNVLGSLVKRLHDGDPDILVFNFSRYDEEKQTYVKPSKEKNNFDFNCEGLCGEDFLITVLRQEPHYAWYSWRYLIKRNFLNTFGFRFKFGIKFEDMELTYQILLKARQVLITDINVYVYRINRIGATTYPNSRDLKNSMDLLHVTVGNVKYILKLQINKELKIMLLNNVSKHYIYVLNRCAGLKEKSERKILYSELKNAQWVLKYSTDFYANIIKKIGLATVILQLKIKHDIKQTTIGKVYLMFKHSRCAKCLKQAYKATRYAIMKPKPVAKTLKDNSSIKK